MFVCIWCESRNRGIALNNQIPWKNKTDLKVFKTLTLNHKIIMGRQTFESLKKPLIDRTNIVLTRNLDFKTNFSDVIVENDIDKLIDKYENSSEVVYVIGGKQIYDAFISKSKILVVSKLHNSIECDLFMTNSFFDFELKKVTFFDDFDVFIYLKKGFKYNGKNC